jgi:hypothetical protein
MNGFAKFVRLSALGLMMMLSVAANCTSESYDPDPYDDIPPVTVDFEYLTPHMITAPSRHEDIVQSSAAGVSGVPRDSFRNIQIIVTALSDFYPHPSMLSAMPLRR